MTISTTTIKNSFTGNGSTTAFTYTFPINTTSEILVIERSATGTETIRAEGSGSTNYGIVNNGSAGGIVTMVTAPVSGVTLILRRNTALTQETDYVANDPFPAETHEDALDKLQMQTQELQEQADRSFKVSRTNTIASSEFTGSATARASKTLGFDSNGNLTTVADFLPAGGDSAQFTYSTTVTDADPGAGFIRFNNTTISSATIAYIDDAEANGTDVIAWVQSFDDVAGNATNRGRIRVSKANTLDTWHVFRVNAAITDASGYTKIPLTYIDGAGSLANNDKVFVSFVSSGEDGAIPGYFYKFATSTTDGDPGAGILRFDNGTYANVTEIYIDDADANGGATQADTETWGSSTSTIKGFLHIVDINDPSTYARFKITAAVSDASGYNKITVVHLASNNTFSAADELSVHFTRTGLKGDTGATGSTGPTGATGDVSLAGTQTLTNKTINASQLVNASIVVGKMAANSVDSDQYVDGSIDTIHIGDNQITLAKMAGGTDGNIISFDASGDPVAIATGNDGQVLTSTGAGSPPAFETAAGGGAFEFVSRTAVGSSAVASIVVGSIATSGVNYFFMWGGIDSAANGGEDLLIQVSPDGSTFRTSGYLSATFQHYSDGGGDDYGASAGFSVSENQTNNGTDEGNTGFAYLMNIASGEKTMLMGQNVVVGDNNRLRANTFGGMYNTAEATTTIRFIFGSGNISANTAGFINVYKQIIA